jgi:hypothetical protein
MQYALLNDKNNHASHVFLSKASYEVLQVKRLKYLPHRAGNPLWILYR